MTEPNEQHEREQSSISLPVIVGAAIFAIAAIAVVGFLLASRDDDPESQTVLPQMIDLAAPLNRDGSTEFRLHLEYDSAEDGEVDLAVHFTQGGDALEPFDPELEGVDLTIAPLTNADEGRTIPLQPAEDARYSPEEPIALGNGWWESTVTIYRSDGDTQSTIFYVLIPDPNLQPVEEEDVMGDSSAQAFYEAGIRQMASTHTIQYIERLTTGEGMVSIVQRAVTDGNGGTPAAHSITAQFELMTIGDRTFQRSTGGTWFEREYLAVYPVSEWVNLYQGANNLVLAESVMLNNRATQIITFFVPASTLAPAHYAWWVDEETGYVVREAMVSTLHYMIYEFGEFNQPVDFQIPIPAASPVSSPLASPAA